MGLRKLILRCPYNVGAEKYIDWRGNPVSKIACSIIMKELRCFEHEKYGRLYFIHDLSVGSKFSGADKVKKQMSKENNSIVWLDPILEQCHVSRFCICNTAGLFEFIFNSIYAYSLPDRYYMDLLRRVLNTPPNELDEFYYKEFGQLPGIVSSIPTANYIL